MEAVIIQPIIASSLTIKQVMERFFKAHTPEETKVLFWKFFQCWVTRDCNIKADLSDLEVAQFFDHLMDLITATHELHEANAAVQRPQEGDDRE